MRRGRERIRGTKATIKDLTSLTGEQDARSTLRPNGSIGKGWLRQRDLSHSQWAGLEARYKEPCGTRLRDHSSRTAADTAARLARGNEDSCDRGTSEGRTRSSRRRTMRDPNEGPLKPHSCTDDSEAGSGQQRCFKRDIIDHMFRNETTYADDCSCRTSHPTTECEGPLSSR